MSCDEKPILSIAPPIWCIDYFQLMDEKPLRFCREQWALREQIEKAYREEGLFIYPERWEKYCSMGKYLGYGNGYEWERFLIGTFLCTYTADGQPRWNRMVVYIGRGAGKDGCISLMSLDLISPYNPVPRYDVDIGAYNETQALRPIEDVRDAMYSHEGKMSKFFSWTQEVIKSKKTKAKLRGWANNSKGLDGLRSGCVFLDEIHAYENNKTIEVFTSGMGKVPDARIGYFTTEGYIQDGPLDSLIKDAHEVLFEDKPDDGWLYYICKLDDVATIDDEETWHQANPSLRYSPSLMNELRKSYIYWKKAPELNKDFLCKRMNIKQTLSAAAVATRAQLEATDKELPDLDGRACVVGIDFSKTTDWAGVNFHFLDGDERYDYNHAFICMQSPDLWRLKCPYEDWAAKGDIDLVYGVEIPPEMVAKYVYDTAQKHGWNVLCVCIDSYRYSLMTHALKKYGWSTDEKNVYLVRPSDIMRVAPTILRCFANDFFTWGDRPHLRWAVNNATLDPAKKSRVSETGELDIGNYIFGKQEPKSRKTDPFMALVASFVNEDLLAEDIEVTADSCFFIDF